LVVCCDISGVKPWDSTFAGFTFSFFKFHKQWTSKSKDVHEQQKPEKIVRT
jgi:hypothetical protein